MCLLWNYVHVLKHENKQYIKPDFPHDVFNCAKTCTNLLLLFYCIPLYIVQIQTPRSLMKVIHVYCMNIGLLCNTSLYFRHFNILCSYSVCGLAPIKTWKCVLVYRCADIQLCLHLSGTGDWLIQQWNFHQDLKFF